MTRGDVKELTERAAPHGKLADSCLLAEPLNMSLYPQLRWAITYSICACFKVIGDYDLSLAFREE